MKIDKIRNVLEIQWNLSIDIFCTWQKAIFVEQFFHILLFARVDLIILNNFLQLRVRDLFELRAQNE